MQLTDAFARSEGGDVDARWLIAQALRMKPPEVVQCPSRHPGACPFLIGATTYDKCPVWNRPRIRSLLARWKCHRVGRRMYNSVCLAGRVILIVEDDRGPFAQQLRAALDWVGARTLLASTPAHARDYVACFDLSAATIYSDDAIHSVEFPQLVKEMGGMPVLLYGAGPPPHQPFKNARFLAASKPSHTGAIVEAVTRLLSSSPGVSAYSIPR